MNRDNYIAGSISTRIYEQNLLTRNELERLNDYDTVEEVLNALNDSIYRDSIADLNRPQDYEAILNKELKRVYDLMEVTSNEPMMLQYLREKYNFHNLKAIVKDVIQKQTSDHLYSEIGNIDIAYIRKNLAENDTYIPDFLDKLDIEGYEPVRIDQSASDIYLAYGRDALNTYNLTENPKDIDIVLDKHYYEKLLIDANELGLESLVNFTRERIDLINIKTMLRVRSQGLGIEEMNEALIAGGFIDLSEYSTMFDQDMNQIAVRLSNNNIGKFLIRAIDSDLSLDENLLGLEKAIDDHKVDYTLKAKMMTYGPEVLLNYILSKETEIKNLRIILVSKLNGLSKDFTAERMRETYA